MLTQSRRRGKKTLANFTHQANDRDVGSFVARLLFTFDHVPAWLAFSFMAIAGSIEALVLFLTKSESDEFMPRSAPYAALAAVMVIAMYLVLSSRPVVVRRETGSRRERLVSLVEFVGRLATFHAFIAIWVLLPAFIFMGKPIDATILSPKPIASALVSASPAPETTPSAATSASSSLVPPLTNVDKPEPASSTMIPSEKR